MIDHYDLCKVTAEWAMKKYNADVAMYEYQNLFSGEFPDVLMFKNSQSTLFEIKTSHTDFLADSKKDCRKKYKNRWYAYTTRDKKFDLQFKTLAPDLYYVEKPHLGKHRYFVCEKGIINKEEVPEGWGLYYFKSGRFYKQKESKVFSRNLFAENDILVHALRNYANGNTEKILVKWFN